MVVNEMGVVRYHALRRLVLAQPTLLDVVEMVATGAASLWYSRHHDHSHLIWALPDTAWGIHGSIHGS